MKVKSNDINVKGIPDKAHHKKPHDINVKAVPDNVFHRMSKYVYNRRQTDRYYSQTKFVKEAIVAYLRSLENG